MRRIKAQVDRELSGVRVRPELRRSLMAAAERESRRQRRLRSLSMGLGVAGLAAALMLVCGLAMLTRGFHLSPDGAPGDPVQPLSHGQAQQTGAPPLSNPGETPALLLATQAPAAQTPAPEQNAENAQHETASTEAPTAENVAPAETPAPEDAQEQAPAAEADNAITRATKADLERPDDLVKLGDFIATAYCVTGQTSTGTQTTVGRTLAVNPHVIPYGTEVWLYLEDGTFAGDFIAEDTGSNMLANSNVIDIYMGEGSYHDCILWGAQNVEVYIRATAEAEQPAQ